jgi:2-polyprenyl-3-methyl-5-hydroxy-6-metoxy-1,4-benzoquinol methylase
MTSFSKTDRSRANEDAKDAWNQNARFWDEQMGEGNDFVEVLIWPVTERLLALKPGERVLDIACGNGLSSRRMAAMKAEVVAFDFSGQMIARAQNRTLKDSTPIQYRVIDATDYDSLLSLGENSFDAALCNMALFDMAEIEPLMRALGKLIRSGGRFVFSVIHPCFNNPHMVHVGELEERGGKLVTSYSVKIHGYMSSTIKSGIAMSGQPVPHPYFHRPLSSLLGAGFEAGLLLDALEEKAFPADHATAKNPLSWGGNYSEIPPVLIARMRIP